MLSEQVRYARSADGTLIAWMASGKGPRTVVVVANDVTDIRSDRANPLRRDALAWLSRHFRVVRYDHRGWGSSQAHVQRQGIEAWVEDLAAVIDAARIDGPCILFGCSQAGMFAPAYAARYPDRVSHLVLVGPVGRGMRARGDEEGTVASRAMLDLIRVSWSGSFPGPRAIIAAGLIMDPTQEESDWIRTLPSQAGNADDAYCFYDASHAADVSAWLPQVHAPTLILQAADDHVVSPRDSRAFAAAISGARYAEAPGCNHALLARDAGFDAMCEEMLAFVAQSPWTHRLPSLSRREEQILDWLCAGLSNEAIALQCGISEKTVRNHLTRVFDKLGVHTRTQAVAIKLRA